MAKRSKQGGTQNNRSTTKAEQFNKTNVGISSAKYDEIYYSLRRAIQSRIGLHNEDISSEDTIAKLYVAIQNGFDVNFLPSVETDPLYSLLNLAVICKGDSCPEIVDMLLNAGADVNITDKSGWNTLMTAASSKGLTMSLENIIKRTSDVNHRSKHGRTALGILCRKYISDAQDDNQIIIKNIKAMLRAGADPDLDDHWNNGNKLAWRVNTEKERKERLDKFINLTREQINALRAKDESVFDYEL